MIIGHVTGTYLVYRLFKKRIASLPAFMFGAWLPDIIDKPLCLLFALPDRSLGHSAIVLSALLIPLMTLYEGRSGIIKAVYLGALLHLLEDSVVNIEELLNAVIWPVAGQFTTGSQSMIVDAMYEIYVLRTSALLFWTEMASVAGCIVLLAYDYGLAGYFIPSPGSASAEKLPEET